MKPTAATLAGLPERHPDTDEACQWVLVSDWSPAADPTGPPSDLETQLWRDSVSGVEVTVERHAGIAAEAANPG